MRSRHAVLLLVPALLVGACAVTPTPSPSSAPPPELRHVTLLLGFQPDVQFAAFYLAQQAGYYADAGLDVTIEYKTGADLVRLVADGQAEFGVTDATDVMISRTAGIPVKYVSTLYDHFPVALIGPKGKVPSDPAELAGKRIGTPGRFGSSWHALLALLRAGGLSEADVTIREYQQFNQVDGLLNGDVDLITGFVANEPLRLAAQGMPVDLMTIDEIAPLPGPGVIAGDALLSGDRALVAAFADATLAAQRAIAADPQAGLEAAIAEVPAIAEDRATALAVLEATIGLWRGAADLPTGNIDQDVWTSGYETMRSLGFIDGSVPLDEMIDQVLGTISESPAPS
jgi:NitT/TauT family transport system substrate-binding protein